MRRFSGIALLLALLACDGGDATSPPNEVLVGGLKWTSTIVLTGDTMEATATAANQSTEPVALALFGDWCELLFRFYSEDGETLLLDEAPSDLVCPDVGGEVVVPAGAQIVRTGRRQLPDLRAGGLSAGTRKAVVVIPRSPGLTRIVVLAGRVEIPEHTGSDGE